MLHRFKVHMGTQTGEKPLSGNVCKMSFTKLSSVKIHMITHTRERLYSCYVVICPSLNHHM